MWAKQEEYAGKRGSLDRQVRKYTCGKGWRHVKANGLAALSVGQRPTGKTPYGSSLRPHPRSSAQSAGNNLKSEI